MLDQHQEQVGGFLGAHVRRKTGLDAGLLDAAKGRVREDDVHPVGGAVVAQRAGQGVVVQDLAGNFDAVQQQVGHAQHVRQLLFLDPANAGLQQGLVLGVVDLLAQVLDGADQKAARARGGVHHGFAQAGVGDVHHELGDGAGGVELARVAGALQVAQDFFVEVVELVALGLAVEVDGAQLVDHLAQQVAAFHVVVGILEHAAHHIGAGRAGRVGAQAFEGGKELVIDKVQQFIAGHALGIRGPMPPAHGFGDGAFVVVPGEFEFFFQCIEHLEEQEPGELADALGIAIDAGVLAHDVLDGFDNGAEVGHGGWRCKVKTGARPMDTSGTSYQ